MRTVVEVQERAQCLRLATRRMGAAKPQTLELVPTSDRRTPTAREAARRNYQRLLERVLTRQFIGSKVDGLRSAMDLEHSFGPAYVRGRLLRGHRSRRGDRRQRGGVGVDGGRRSDAGNSLAGPLPPARRRAAALWRAQGDCAGRSLANHGRAHGLAEPRRRRLPAFYPRRAQRRACAGGLSRHRQPGLAAGARIFRRQPPSSAARRESTACSRWSRLPRRSASRFGPARPPKSGCCCTAWNLRACARALPPTPLPAKMRSALARAPTKRRSRRRPKPLCRDLFSRLFLSRHGDGAHTDPLFRLQPERWLEARLRAEIAELLPGLRKAVPPAAA